MTIENATPVDRLRRFHITHLRLEEVQEIKVDIDGKRVGTGQVEVVVAAHGGATVAYKVAKIFNSKGFPCLNIRYGISLCRDDGEPYGGAKFVRDRYNRKQGRELAIARAEAELPNGNQLVRVKETITFPKLPEMVETVTVTDIPDVTPPAAIVEGSSKRGTVDLANIHEVTPLPAPVEDTPATKPLAAERLAKLLSALPGLKPGEWEAWPKRPRTPKVPKPVILKEVEFLGMGQMVVDLPHAVVNDKGELDQSATMHIALVRGILNHAVDTGLDRRELGVDAYAHIKVGLSPEWYPTLK